MGDLFILDQPLRDLHAELRNYHDDTEDDEDNVEPSCPPTLPFGIFARIEMLFPCGPKSFKVEDALTLDAIRDLWHGHFHANADTRNLCEGARFDFSEEPWEFNALASDVALVIQDGEFAIMHRHGTRDCESFLSTLDCEGPWYDQFGAVGVGQACDDCVLFSQTAMSHVPMNISKHEFLAACKESTCLMTWDAATDAIVVTFQATDESVRLLQGFWKDAIDPVTARMLGFRVSSGCLESRPFLQFIMESYRTLPPQTWLLSLAVAGSRSFLETLMAENGVPVILRWCGRPLWIGALRGDLLLGQLMDVLKITLSPIGRGAAFRLIHCSKRLPGDMSLREMANERAMTCYTIQIVQALRGGGGGKQMPRTQVKNSIATTLLEHGHELRWVGRSVDKLMEGNGAQQASVAINKPQGQPRYDAILQLLKSCGIAVQTESTKSVPAGSNPKKRIVDVPDLSGFVIQQGFFTNEDEQLIIFCPQSSGVHLTSAELALPWLRESQVLAKDELALLCVGSSSLPTSLEHVPVTVPCVSPAGDQVILAAVMVQLGEKKVKITKGKHQSSKDQHCVMAMTMWKQDWNDEDWQKCIFAPVGVLKNIMVAEDGNSMIQTSWGRSLRHRRKLVLPDQASSVQLHVAVLPEHLTTILEGSGFNKIFCTPKRRDGRPDDAYKVIWIEGDLARLTAISYKVSRCLGLVRGRDGMGIRLHRDHFAAAWAIIYPSLPMPHVEGNMNLLYKLEPLPYGTSSAALEEWAKVVSWEIKPIKPLGARAWLLGTAVEPPSSFLLFNTTPVMAKYLPPRESNRQNLVVAGRLTKQKPDAPWDHSDVTSIDPWAKYKMNNGNQPASSVASLGSTASRSVTGPTEAKFTEQSARITKLEEQVSSMAQKQQEQRQEIQEQFEGVAKREQTTHNMLATLRSDFNQAITHATSMQTKELHSSLNELKEMFATSMATVHKRPRPAPGLDAGDQSMLDAPAS